MFISHRVFTSSEVSRLGITVYGRDFFQDFVGCDKIPKFRAQKMKRKDNGKVDWIDTWEMTVTPIGSAGPGKFDYTPPKSDWVVRLTPYKPGEVIREVGQ